MSTAPESRKATRVSPCDPSSGSAAVADLRRTKKGDNQMTTMKQVDDFLGLKRIAVVGVSRDPKGFGTVLWQEFRQRRYEAIPVNPVANEIDGQPCYARVQDIQPPVDGALIMTSAKSTDQIVADCAEAGIKHVWMYGGMAPGAKTKTAVAFCEEHLTCSWRGRPPSTLRTACGRRSRAAIRSSAASVGRLDWFRRQDCLHCQSSRRAVRRPATARFRGTNALNA